MLTGLDFTEHRPNWRKKQGSPSPESPHPFDMNVNCYSRYILDEESVFNSRRRRGLAGSQSQHASSIREHRNLSRKVQNAAQRSMPHLTPQMAVLILLDTEVLPVRVFLCMDETLYRDRIHIDIMRRAAQINFVAVSHASLSIMITVGKLSNG